MSVSKLANLLGLGLFLAVVTVGCKSTKYGKTPLPESGRDKSSTSGNSEISSGGTVKSDEGARVTSDLAHPFADPNLRKDWPRDAEMFKADTIHFDYDSSVIKAADKPKAAAVATYLKANPLDAIEVDG